MIVLDGRTVAAKWRAAIAAEVAKFGERGIQPGLAVLLVGDEPASVLYTSMKERISREVGFHSVKVTLPRSVTTREVIAVVDQFNHDSTIHGVLIQLPLPSQVDTDAVLEALDPTKDADGLQPKNLGDLLIGHESVVPATPRGIMKLLEAYAIETEGKHVVIVGRSNILGKPLAALFLNRNATVTVCHSKTMNLASFTRQANIIVMDTGVQGLLTADMVGEDVVVIDAGITQLPDGRVVGDVDFPSVSQKVAALTPVPGGVGPMTIAALLDNTLRLAHRALGEPADETPIR